jgi:hypothetical protein
MGITRADLAEMVMDHLSRGIGEGEWGIIYASSGLVSVGNAYSGIQYRKDELGQVLDNLRNGCNDLGQALPRLRAHFGERAAALIAFVERELYFASSLIPTVERMKAAGR